MSTLSGRRGTFRPGLWLCALVATAMVASACSQSTPVAPAPSTANPEPTTPPPPPTEAGPARYRVTFTATWTPATHRQEAPDDPHFSPLVGGTHHAGVSLWREGALASDGIRRMAELGAVSPLDDEVRAAIAAGTAQHLLTGGGTGSPGTVTFAFDISPSHPLVTLVTMVAPSPDWFVGVSGLPLLEKGVWVDQRVVSLTPWDAGTDSGLSFRSPDQRTLPPQPISRIVTPPLAVNGEVAPLGTFTFTRLDV